MATYRCPTHDCLIETETDQAPPGKVKKGADGKPDELVHPLGCHPDCPVGKRERAEAKKTSTQAARPAGASLTRRIG